MITKWRPEGWAKRRDENARKDFTDLALGKNVNMFESGADAMLEALKVKGISTCPSPDNSGRVYVAFKTEVAGTVVFIPDGQ